MVKGILLSAMPDAGIVDVSHEVPPFRKDIASYLLRSTYPHFAQGTVHLVLVDMFHDTVPRLVCCHYNEQYYIAPDNGILPAAFKTNVIAGRLCFELINGSTFADCLSAAARCATLMLAGNIESLPSISLATTAGEQPERSGADREFTLNVQYVDHFGNAVTNLHLTQFEKMNPGRRFRLDIMHVAELTAISGNYSDVAAGEHLCRFNKNGLMEICVNQGSAANLFGLRPGGQHNYLKIMFE